MKEEPDRFLRVHVHGNDLRGKMQGKWGVKWCWVVFYIMVLHYFPSNLGGFTSFIPHWITPKKHPKIITGYYGENHQKHQNTIKIPPNTTKNSILPSKYHQKHHFRCILLYFPIHTPPYSYTPIPPTWPYAFSFQFLFHNGKVLWSSRQPYRV